MVRFWIITMMLVLIGLSTLKLQIESDDAHRTQGYWCWGSVTPDCRWRAGSRARAARVRVADTRAAPPALDALRAAVPDAEIVTGAFTEALLDGVELVAMSPGVVRSRRRSSGRRARAGSRSSATSSSSRASSPASLGARRARDHRLERQEHRHRDGGRDVPRRRRRLRGGGQHRPAGARRADAAARRGGRLPDVFVLELSSFQLESTASLRADAATVLNVTEDHLDRYDGLADYAAAKARIFDGDGVQVLNRDDPREHGHGAAGRRVVTFGLDAAPDPERLRAAQGLRRALAGEGATPLVAVRELPARGTAQRRERARRARALSRHRPAARAAARRAAQLRRTAAPARESR